MGRVTELLGAKGPQVVTFFLPHCTWAQWQAVSEGRVRLPAVDTDSSVTCSGKSHSWTRSSCTAWRTCVAAPSTSAVSGKEADMGTSGGPAGKGQGAWLGSPRQVLPSPPSSESPCVPKP